ncbi:MAG: Planctomycete cytochrome [Verrucomicrobiales bacterium]|nr:Planctomycete cytochrome [Verrucomicrobiales bacterium]
MKILRASFLLCLVGPLTAEALETKVSFNRDIRPILSENCYYCHGFDPAHREADLRLDSFEGAVADGAIVPGKPEESEMIKRIFSTDPDELMPLPASHRVLTPAQKELLKNWIAQGAEYQPHWAFIAPAPVVEVPAVSDAGWARGEVDRFVLARLEQEKMKPTPEAGRERWLRRVTWDLTGLPSSQKEINDFLTDAGPQAYETVVDRLLASPRFGERMAVPWLDLARYADSFGYQSDIDTRAWPWRDWVIRALNENLPWDQFITWQIAGDLLPEATRDQRLATAFNRIHRKTNEGGSIEEEMRQEGVSDRVHTFGTAFLGLTMECCRCHDHKYDPVTARDYYSLGAFFNNIDEAGVMQYATGILPQPALLLPTAAQEETLKAQGAAVEKAEAAVAVLPAEREEAFRAWLAAGPQAAMPDLAGDYPLENVVEGKFHNTVDAASPAGAGGNQPTEGREGRGLLMNGDDALSLPALGIQHAHDPMTFCFWLKPGEAWPRAVILSNTASADTNYSGFELMWEEGILSWTVMRELPGNAISIRSLTKLPVGEWSRITAVYDGSMKAAGLRLYLNGKPMETRVTHDRLTRDYQIGSGLLFGARMRDFGLRGGILDEVRVFRRAITELEVAMLHDGGALAGILKNPAPDSEQISKLKAWFLSAVDPTAREAGEKLHAARDAVAATLRGIPEISVMEEAVVPKPAFVLTRGAYDAPGAEVPRAVPAVLPALPEGAPANRLGLAAWLTRPDHPLTARVLVNRLWQEFFGRGLVATSDNFGSQGSPPSHPELLDWLARQFINEKWDHKAMCRRIVLSAVYRQDSRAAAEARAADPDNILLGRGPSHRLTAEMLRDGALALGGLLRPEVGGPPVYPPQAEGSMWNALNNFLPAYPVDAGPGKYRRSLYTFWRRTTTPPNMMALDSASRDVCAARRAVTNTPLQPLVLMNDPQFAEAAFGLGRRMLADGGATLETRVKWLFREVSGRDPDARELVLLLQLAEEQEKHFRGHGELAALLVKSAGASLTDPDQIIDAAAAATTASAVMNLDASLMVR